MFYGPSFFYIHCSFICVVRVYDNIQRLCLRKWHSLTVSSVVSPYKRNPCHREGHPVSDSYTREVSVRGPKSKVDTVYPLDRCRPETVCPSSVVYGVSFFMDPISFRSHIFDLSSVSSVVYGSQDFEDKIVKTLVLCNVKQS